MMYNDPFSKAARNHVVADSANFREQRQLERQLRVSAVPFRGPQLAQTSASSMKFNHACYC